MQVTTAVSELTPKLAFSEILSFAVETFCSNKVQYMLNQIQGIGANLIYAEYEGGAQHITSTAPDPLTADDMKAAREQVSGIIAASPVVTLGERIPVGDGKERDIQILGVYPEYHNVRNLVVTSGRFFDERDEQSHTKVGLVTEKMAQEIYGSGEAVVGKIIKLSGLPFTVIGTFRERVNTFGESEVTINTLVIPYTV